MGCSGGADFTSVHKPLAGTGSQSRKLRAQTLGDEFLLPTQLEETKRDLANT